MIDLTEVQTLREKKGKEQETLDLVNRTIIKLLWEKTLTYQHIYRHNGNNKVALNNMNVSVSEAKSYIDKYKIKDLLPTHYLLLGKISDFKNKFGEAVKYYKKAPKTAETDGHLAYALIMSGKTTEGFKLATKSLKDIDTKKDYLDLKNKDYYTWAVWKSGIVIRTVAALIVKKAKFDRELINKWVKTVEGELKVKKFDFSYRVDELNKLKQKLQEG